MDYEEAKLVLERHTHHQSGNSFVGAFARNGVGVPDQGFHQLMEAILVVGERIHIADHVDRDVMASLWSLAYWTRSFGPPRKGNYASKSNSPPTLSREDFKTWLDIIEGTVLGILNGSPPRHQVGRYADYLESNEPGDNISFFVKLMIEALEDDGNDCPTDVAEALATLGAVSSLPALRKALERTYGQDDPLFQEAFEVEVKRVLSKAIRTLEGGEARCEVDPGLTAATHPSVIATSDELFAAFARAGDSFYHAGQIDFTPGHSVKIIVTMADAEPVEFPDVLQRAREALANLRQIEPHCRRTAFGELVELYNAEHSPSDDELLDDATFAERIQLKTITFYPDGSAELDYATDDLFQERMPSLWVSPTGEPGRAKL